MVLWRFGRGPSDAPEALGPPLAPAAEAPAGTPPSPDAPGGLPSALEGSEPEGELLVDEAGRFVPGPEALRLFDYYLTAQDEETEDVIRARIEDEIQERLAPEAAAQARDLLDRYLRYLHEGREMGESGTGADELAEHARRLHELRHAIFGPAVAALLFDEEERMTQVAIERRRILDDPSLDDRARIQRLAALQAQLPADVREAEAQAMAPLRLAREEEELRQAGASDAEIRALREETVGVDAAERLQQLDRRRADWAERLAAYRTERDRVLENVKAGDDANRAYYLRGVRERYFSPEELPRVEALDRIEMRERSHQALPPAPGPNPQETR